MSVSRTVASGADDDDGLAAREPVDREADPTIMPRSLRFRRIGQPGGHVERARVPVGEHQQRRVEREPARVDDTHSATGACTIAASISAGSPGNIASWVIRTLGR